MPGVQKYWDGQHWLEVPPPAGYAPPTIVIANGRKPPGGGALFLSIIGFCGITAIIGVILGLMARSDAKKNGLGTARANAAIIIGLVWIVPGVIFWITFATTTRSAIQNAATPVATVSAPSSTPVGSPTAPPPSRPPVTTRQKVVTLLENRGFSCTAPSGAVQLQQCKKGTVKVPVYGTQARELINIDATGPSGTDSIGGYVLPATAKALAKFGIKNLGDDGSGTGVVEVSN